MPPRRSASPLAAPLAAGPPQLLQAAPPTELHPQQQHPQQHPQRRSVLDDLGEEITGVVAPVALCMALVVLLVKLLNPDGGAGGATVSIATIAYREQAGDSAGAKLGGALLNAVIFVAVIAAMTFVLFLLFKWGCYRAIYAYMGFAMLNVFFFLTGALVVQLLRLAGAHVDVVSLSLLLFNFSVVGILALFFLPVPLLLKQGYTLWVGVCVAYLFTHVPEWTSWVLLVAMALYDLAAVLLPGGPLKILVELAVERQQELPALVYESRPTRGPYRRGQWRRQRGGGGNGDGGDGDGDGDGNGGTGAGGGAAAAIAAAAAAAAAAPVHGGGLAAARDGGGSGPCVALLAGHARNSSDEDERLEQELAARRPSSSARRNGGGGPRPLGEGREAGDDGGALLTQQQQQQQERRPRSRTGGRRGGRVGLDDEERQQGAAASSSGGGGGGSDGRRRRTSSAGPDGGGDTPLVALCPPGQQARASRHRAAAAAGDAAEAQPLSPRSPSSASSDDGGREGGSGGGHPAAPTNTNAAARAASDGGSSSSDGGLPDGIKLGLGDFIFYSMLVGRAAMYDLLTVYASSIAVVAGLVVTLLLLALTHRALPALPVSVALGVAFYFLTRLVVEPFVVPLSLNLLWY